MENENRPPVPARRGALDRFLNVIEVAGNKLPDPAVLFVIALFLVWVLSWILSPIQFQEIDPRNGKPIQVQNLLTGTAIAAFLANMINVFVTFPPLGVVLVAMLGVGVAVHRRVHRAVDGDAAAVLGGRHSAGSAGSLYIPIEWTLPGSEVLWRGRERDVNELRVPASW
jgi:hypothetical protein